ncbi:MAG: ATP-binding protein [Thermaurantimonas sp.]
MWNFSKLFTNPGVHNHLRETVSNGQVGHAQIFYGREGSEVLPTAIAFVKYIFCKNKLQDDACNTCQDCRQIDSMNHPDFKIYFPLPFVKGKIEKSADLMSEFIKHFKENPYMDLFLFSQKLMAEKKSFSIPTGECESINKFLGLKSFYGGKKVVLIWYPEFLNTAGANKLLKTIEEPLGDTLILFVSHNIHEILPTIVSRCQSTVFKNPDINQIKDFLRNKINVDSRLDTEFASSLVDLTLGDINEMISNTELFVLFDKICSEFTDFIFSRMDENQILSIHNHIEMIAGKGREYTKHFLKYFSNKIRKKYLTKNATEKTVEFLIFIQDVIDYHIMLVDRNVSIKMILLSLLISGKNGKAHTKNFEFIKESFLL